jgi:aspartate/methionine/tyrosine aminotransferase
MRAQGKEIISLGLGEPDFKTRICCGSHNESDAGWFHPLFCFPGWPELRKLIAEDCNKN